MHNINVTYSIVLHGTYSVSDSLLSRREVRNDQRGLVSVVSSHYASHPLENTNKFIAKVKFHVSWAIPTECPIKLTRIWAYDDVEHTKLIHETLEHLTGQPFNTSYVLQCTTLSSILPPHLLHLTNDFRCLNRNITFKMNSKPMKCNLSYSGSTENRKNPQPIWVHIFSIPIDDDTLLYQFENST